MSGEHRSSRERLIRNSKDATVTPAQEFDTPENALAHYGVKGMKWGVRKKREEGSSGSSEGTNDPMDDVVTPKLTSKQKAAALSANEANFINKFDDPGPLLDGETPPKGGLTSQQKKVIVLGGLGAVYAGMVAYQIYQDKNLEIKAATGDREANLKLFNRNVDAAKFKTWNGTGFITKDSWKREAFELPEGHVFHRISTKDESKHGFSSGTYSTTNIADFDRYVAGFRKEKGFVDTFYHVTYTAKGPTKVPNLETVITSLQGEMSKLQNGAPATKSQAIDRYNKMSGQGWADSLSVSLFKSLREQGYSALVDEMDAGVIGDKPIVFFGDANPKKAAPMTPDELRERELSVKRMGRPPRKA